MELSWSPEKMPLEVQMILWFNYVTQVWIVVKIERNHSVYIENVKNVGYKRVRSSPKGVPRKPLFQYKCQF